MAQETYKRGHKVMSLVLFIALVAGLALASVAPARPVSAGNGTGDEILVFNRGSKSTPFTVTQTMSGFIMDKPPTGAANANWVSGTYAGFSGGTLYFRARIVSIPKNQSDMKLGFCFWQQKRENCRGQKIAGIPGTEMQWQVGLANLWKKNKIAINWAEPRTKHGFIVRDGQNDPVSLKTSTNWGGNNPADWYPMKIHYTVVLVKQGGTFDGWQNYGW